MASPSAYDDDDDDDDDDEVRREEPVDGGSVATIASFALLAVGVVAFVGFQVAQPPAPKGPPMSVVVRQNAAFSGSKDAPQIQKVQAHRHGLRRS